MAHENAKLLNNDFENEFGKLDFNLITDYQLCQKMVEDLENGIKQIDALSEEIKSLPLKGWANERLGTIKWDLNKYSLLKSDCRWQDNDDELKSTLANQEMCYRQMTSKSEHTLGDVFYILWNLQNMKETFDAKISQIREIISI